MSKKIHKSLQDYLSKIKPLPSANSLSSSKNWVLNGCKHPKTASFAADHKNGVSSGNNDNGDDSATLSDIDFALFENFKSLYRRDDEGDQNHKRVSEENQETTKLTPILFDSPRFVDPPPDLCGSSRFFVAPGSSSSLIEEARTSVTATAASDEAQSSSSSSMSSTTLINYHSSCSNSHDQVQEHVTSRPLTEDCIAVYTFSHIPYEDFRRSMQEMVEARLRNNERVDWDFLEDLFFCYLNLNEKASYKFILNAFVDLIVFLHQKPERIPTQAASKSRGRRSQA